MGKFGQATRGVTHAFAAAARLLKLNRAPAPSAPDEFRKWLWADDGDLEELGELNRRMMRDRALRLLDREAELIARGHRSRDLAWIAQELPATHPRRAAVRAFAFRIGVPLAFEYSKAHRARLRARLEAAAQRLDELDSTQTRAAGRSMRDAHELSATLALQLAFPWRRALDPRAPAADRLA
jgi:hypothetical protein